MGRAKDVDRRGGAWKDKVIFLPDLLQKSEPWHLAWRVHPLKYIQRDFFLVFDIDFLIILYTHYDTAQSFLTTRHRQFLIKWLNCVVIYTAHNDLWIQFCITRVLLTFNSKYLKRLEVFYTQLFKVNEQYIPRTLQQPRGEK